ncbi:MAG: hypothetical protein VX107_20120, partial [Pseudomonadota bacterium]|nr:hypothetical protein [Pseudomonadota bacterium]
MEQPRKAIRISGFGVFDGVYVSTAGMYVSGDRTVSRRQDGRWQAQKGGGGGATYILGRSNTDTPPSSIADGGPVQTVQDGHYVYTVYTTNPDVWGDLYSETVVRNREIAKSKWYMELDEKAEGGVGEQIGYHVVDAAVHDYFETNWPHFELEILDLLDDITVTGFGAFDGTYTYGHSVEDALMQDETYFSGDRTISRRQDGRWQAQLGDATYILGRSSTVAPPSSVADGGPVRTVQDGHYIYFSLEDSLPDEYDGVSLIRKGVADGVDGHISLIVEVDGKTETPGIAPARDIIEDGNVHDHFDT